MTRERLIATIPAVAWTVLVVILISLPGRSIPETNLLEYDKAAHAVMFAVGVYLWLRVPPASTAFR